jgi:hypothetical protein
MNRSQKSFLCVFLLVFVIFIYVFTAGNNIFLLNQDIEISHSMTAIIIPLIFAQEDRDLETALKIRDACQYYKDTKVINIDRDCTEWINTIEGKQQFYNWTLMKIGQIFGDFKNKVRETFSGIE